MTSDTPVSGSKRRTSRASPPIRRARMSFKTASCLVLLCLACLFVPVAARRKALQTNPPSRPAGIIATDGGRFVDPSDGSTFHVAGANCYYLAYSSGAEQGSYEHDWVAEVRPLNFQNYSFFSQVQLYNPLRLLTRHLYLLSIDDITL